MSEFEDRIYQELQTVQQFRFKLSLAKISFVSGLLGIGAMKLTSTGNNDLSQLVLYLVPLVAVLFDILGMGATVAIYRTGAFLRVESNPSEKTWQNFLKENRSSFSWWGATGFTVVTFSAAIMVLLAKAQWTPFPIDVFWWKALWFAGILVLWVSFRFSECRAKHRFESLNGIKSGNSKRCFIWRLLCVHQTGSRS